MLHTDPRVLGAAAAIVWLLLVAALLL